MSSPDFSPSAEYGVVLHQLLTLVLVLASQTGLPPKRPSSEAFEAALVIVPHDLCVC